MVTGSQGGNEGLPSRRVLQPGDAFDRYCIEEAIGEGGMGSVYRALDSKLHRRVALKILRVDREGDQERWRDAAARLVREARAAAALDHPNAVSIFDVGEVDGAPFIAMELVPGRTLRAFIGDTETPWPRKLRWLVDMAAALEAAHKAGLVHRDIKPENVMIRDDGRVKVLDFGIARRAASEAQGDDPTQAPGVGTLTGKGVIIGTLRYMPPEQLAARPIDGRADQFAWAVTAYELLAGTTPWPPTSDAIASISAILTAPPRPLQLLMPELPFDVSSAIMRGLSKAPDDRFATMGDLLSTIEHFAAAPVRNSSLRPEGTSQPAIRTPPARSTGTAVDPHGQTAQRPSTVRAVAVDSKASPSSPPPGEVTVPSAGRGRAGTLAAIVAGVAIAAVAGAVGHRMGTSPASTTAPSTAAATSAAAEPARDRDRDGGGSGLTTVLILGVENKTGDPSLDETLGVVLYSSLLRAPSVEPVVGAELRTLAAEIEPERQELDETLGKKLASREDRQVVMVRGSVATKGAGYELSVTATDATSGAVLVSKNRDVPKTAELVPAVGTVACEIRAALGHPAPCEPGTSQETGMSGSIEADHELSVARGLHRVGRDDEALVHLDRAIVADPEFAQAHAFESLLLNNFGRRTEADVHARLALKWIDRMGDRERLKFLGDYYLAGTGEYDKSIASYDELLRKWPRNRGAEVNIAYAYAYKRDMTRALELARTAANDHPRDSVPRGDLPSFYIWANDFASAVREVQKVEADFPHADFDVFVHLGVAQYMLGHASDAAAAYGKAQALYATRGADALADLAAAEGRLDEAASLLDKGIADDEAHKNQDESAHKWAMLAEVRLRKGDRAGALAAASKAATVDSPAPLYAAAMIELGAGDAKKALAIATRLSEAFAPDPRLFSKLIQAEAMRVAGKPHDALPAIQEAQKVVDSWLGHFLLGRIYLDAKAFPEARGEFTSCLARRGEGALAYLDEFPTLRYIPQVTYYLARAQEGLASPDAADSYRAFLALEPDADHDPLVSDARKRAQGAAGR